MVGRFDDALLDSTKFIYCGPQNIGASPGEDSQGVFASPTCASAAARGLATLCDATGPCVAVEQAVDSSCSHF